MRTLAHMLAAALVVGAVAYVLVGSFGGILTDLLAAQ